MAMLDLAARGQGVRWQGAPAPFQEIARYHWSPRAARYRRGCVAHGLAPVQGPFAHTLRVHMVARLEDI